jgi:hypothetical protein
MQIIVLKKCSNFIGYGSHTKGRTYMGRIEKRKETRKWNVVDVVTV